ncbi:hypothetical protein RDWZM_005842 [Blomia tropicalis]|uniref:Uncharacterized protein n=1 Tax=Blomia tropicalis TaxID=40697 RepID=A0A9Q0RN01_BLOTA|nr:hypothetical protein RDWZM_005842 [Blomia tropicalis]
MSDTKSIGSNRSNLAITKSVKSLLPSIDNSNFPNEIDNGSVGRNVSNEVDSTNDENNSTALNSEYVYEQVDTELENMPEQETDKDEDEVEDVAVDAELEEISLPEPETSENENDTTTETERPSSPSPPPPPPKTVESQTSDVLNPKGKFNSGHSAASISANVDSTASIYDSDEKLVFARSTSDYSSILGDHSNLWHNLCYITMAPYMMVGVPVLGILNLSQQPDRINTPKQWFKYLFSTNSMMIGNSVELSLVVIINLYIVFLFIEPLYILIRYGQMSGKLISLSVHLYEMIPLIVGLNIVWPKGFNLSNIIRVLDTKMLPKEAARNVSLIRSLSKMLISFACLLILTGVHRRIHVLNAYIRSMSDDISSLNLLDFQRLKDMFKQNADVICRVNYAFNLLVSDILIIVLINVFKDLFQLFMLGASIDSLSISFTEPGPRRPDPEMLAKAAKWIAIDVIVVICKCMLIWLTVNKVRHANRDIKRISSHLHELASHYIEKPSVIYQSFSLVKSYIKVRNEQSENPAILRLYAARWIPCVSTKF